MTWCSCKVKVSVSESEISPDSRTKADELFRTFENTQEIIGSNPRRLRTDANRPEESVMTFLKVMTGSPYCLYRSLKEGMPDVSSFISTKAIEKGRPMLLWDSEVQTLIIHSFPRLLFIHLSQLGVLLQASLHFFIRLKNNEAIASALIQTFATASFVINGGNLT